MRSEDQIKRMILQLRQLEERLDPTRDKEQISELRGKIEMLEWVIDAPMGKYHV